MSKTVSGAVLLLLAFAVAPVAQAQTTVPELVESYTGQRRILRSYGDRSHASFPMNRSALGGDCDVAVEVVEAEYRGGRARFKLEHIGRLNVGSRVPLCEYTPHDTVLDINRIADGELAEAVAEVIDRFLMTPEDYLAERGIGFEVRRDSAGRPVVRQNFAGEGSRLGGSGGDCWLVIYPDRPRGARKPKVGERVLVEATLGTDGAFQQPRVVESLGPKLDEGALRALSLWRCEPMRREGKLVAIQMQVPVTVRRN